ncbi:MAG: glycosyltransferase, partial [Candidatus Baldrarchaeia archaeon]
MSRLSSDIIVLFPGFLEALTRRGGGREKRLLEIALRLSKYYKIIIIAPFFAKYYKIIKINPRLIINNLYFPSVKDYPPKSNFTKIMQLISIFFYIFEATIKIIQLKDKRLKILVVSDVTSILPAIVAKLLKLKVLYYEGNTELWDGHEKNIIQKFYQAFYIFLGSLLGKMSDALIVNDGIIKERMIDKGIEKCKIFIVRGATDTNKFKLLQLKNSIKRKEDGSLIVGFIGRLTKEKGVALLLEMCRKTRIKLPNVKYIILGDGPY